jgi:hypothetical protein
VKTVYLGSCALSVGLAVVNASINRTSPNTTPRDGMFFHLHSATTPLQLLARLAWLSAALFITYNLNSNFEVWSLIAFRWLLITCCIVGFFMLIVVMARIGFPVSKPKGWFSFVIDFAVLGILGHLSFHLISNLLTTVARLEDVKCGLLLALASVALLILSKGRSDQSSQKEALIELRQEIAFGTLTGAEAKHRTRIALQGLFLSDVVAKDIGRLLKLIDDVRRIYSDAFARIETLKNAVDISSGPIATLDSVAKIALANTLDVLVTYESNVFSISTQYFKQLENIKWRMSIVLAASNRANSDKQILLAEIKHAQALADADLQRFENEYKILQDFWNSHFPNEPRTHHPFSSPKK